MAQSLLSSLQKSEFLKLSPKTCTKTFVNCSALELSVFQTKQLRNVFGQVIGQEN